MKKVKIVSKQSPTESDTNDDTGTDGVLFWINKSGFPISDHVWERMFSHASKLHPGGESVINNIKNCQNTTPVNIPKPPSTNASMVTADRRVAQVQQYMCELQYNHTGTQFFDIKKYRSMTSQSETAREMIKESLPIKCLEAVILGIYLTNGVAGLERYPLGFRSVFGSNVHRHVVLVVSWNGLFGALGMSRRADLMYKPLQFSSLSDLVIDFIESYNQYRHKVNKVKIGFPVSHDPHSHEAIQWKGCVVNPCKVSKTELKQAVEKHSKDIRAWVRQAPFGSTYAPRPQANSYPAPTLSHTSPTKHKSTNDAPLRDSAVHIVVDETTSLNASQDPVSKSTAGGHAAGSKPNFEMRI